MMNFATQKTESMGLVKHLEACNTRSFIWFIGGYVALHFLLRILFSPVIGTDDVTQAIYAQKLALGYEFRQPPLYTWLQWGCDHLVGVGVYSHILLKYLLLFTTYLFLYLIGRMVFVRHSTAAIASLSLWLTFPFAISIHQGVTHSILLSALIAVSVFAFLKLERKPTLPGYLGLGLWLGLGIFSKYGFIVFILAFVLAASSLPRFRRVLVDKRIMLTMGVILLIAIPPLVWLVEQQTAIARTVSALAPAGGVMAKAHLRLANIGSLVSSVVQFLAPLWILLLIFFPKVLRKSTPPTDTPDREAYQQLLGRAIMIALGLLVLGMLLGLLGKVQPRWMHAFLLLFPIYFFARAERAYPEGVEKPGYLLILIALPIIIIVLWAGQTYLGPHMRKATRFHAPYDLLAEHLRKEQPAPNLIIAWDEYLAANLRLGFPGSPVITPSFSYRPQPINTGTCLVIWQSINGKELTPEIAPFVANPASLRDEDIQTWKHNYRYSNMTMLEVAYVYLPITSCKIR